MSNIVRGTLVKRLRRLKFIVDTLDDGEQHSNEEIVEKWRELSGDDVVGRTIQRDVELLVEFGASIKGRCIIYKAEGKIELVTVLTNILNG